MQSALELQSDLVRLLQTPEAFSHPAGDIQHLETHISHIILAGDYAYKIKKSVDLGFLDFSTLEKRRHFCDEELRLNRRLAPHIYLRVVPVGGGSECPAFDGAGPAVEYAVQMRRFPQSALLTRFPLGAPQVDRMARQVAAFHAGIPRVDGSGSLGTSETLRKVVFENFRQIRLRVGDPTRLARLEPIERWTRQQFERLKPVLEQRRRDGFVRECHGDMHLGNMALVDGEIVIFDGIEFSPVLRWIDVMSEVAFLVMDLEYTGQAALGWRFLNAYLEFTGDYEGLTVLRFYQVYRALVRAKVEVIRLGQCGLSEQERQEILDEVMVHVQLAEGYIRRRRAGVLITRGVSGTGKTSFTQRLLERLPGVRVRSDVERKRLFGLPREARTDAAGPARGIYAPETTAATYDRLLALVRSITEAGDSVIVDATFLKHHQRVMFLEFTREKDLPFLMLAFEAPVSLLRRRVEKRQAEGVDASEANVSVLEAQLVGEEPLSREESKFSMRLNFSDSPPITPVLERWQQLLQE